MSDPEANEPPNNEPNSLPSEDQESENAPTLYRSEEFVYRAPLPPPAWMDEYDRIVPGSAERMMNDVHEQSAHRRQIEREESQTESTLAKRGQWFGFATAFAGFVAVMTAIVGGIVLLYSGVSIGAGLALSLGALAAIAAVFVANRFAARPPAQENPIEDPVTVRQELPPGSSGS